MFVRATVVGFVSSVSIAILAVLLCISPAVAEGGASGSFPDRMFSVVRSTPVGSGDTFEVELLPQATGEWWVTADAVAGSFLRVSVWRNNAGSMVLETSSKLRSAGETSVKTSLTAGIAYRAIFAQFGRPGTSVLREQFTWVRQDGAAGPDTIYDIATVGSSVYATGFETIPAQDALLRKFDSGGGVVWTRHFGAGTWGVGVAVDQSGVYVTGNGQALPGQPTQGVFLRKYDFDGNELWTRQFSTGSTDNVGGVAADGTGAYIAGSTFGTLPGESSAGDQDVYLRKYDPDGNELWTRQFGSSGSDGAAAVSANPSGIYLAGATTGVLAGGSNAGHYDAFVARYDSNGNAVWTRQFGAADFDYGLAIDVTGTEVYVAGRATGFSGCPFGGCSGAFVRKYDSDGNEMWTRAIGTEAFAVDADGTSVYVAGWTDGTLPGQSSAGSADAFICKYDSDGNEIWTRQFGTSGYDVAHDIEASGLYVAGRTGGAFPGQSNAGSEDAFLARQPR